ncbi:MAG TPA: PH domain-containing protein [Rhodanobacteraceae bacterium]
MPTLNAFDASEAWRSPSPKLWNVRCLQAGIAAILATAAAGIVAGVYLGWKPGLLAAAIVAVLSLSGLRALYRRVKTWRYIERDDDLMVQRGLWVHRLSVVPYGRMQFVDVEAGPFERVFGVATLHMHTAAAASDAIIPGLPKAEADRLRDALSQRGQARLAGL